MDNDILKIFPAEKRSFWKKIIIGQEALQEIRIRVGGPIIVLIGGHEFFISKTGELQDRIQGACCVDTVEIEQLLNHICHYSLYAYEDEFRQGFLTVTGGHRIGIAGQVVREGDGSIRTIKNISFINIRIAHQIKGAADAVLPALYRQGKLKNVLIISPPGCGKTTLLRDLIRQVSNGNAYGKGCCVGVVDERSEIAGSCQGMPQNDVGIRTDVLDACPKKEGMMLLLRSMSPNVIAIDELGGEEEMYALRMASYCGVGILATVHGDGIKDVTERFQWEDVLREGIFDLFLVLGRRNGKPYIREMIKKEEIYAANSGRNNDNGRLFGSGDVVQAAVCPATEKFKDIAGNS